MKLICVQCRTEPLLIQDDENKDRWYCPQCDYEWNKEDRLPGGTGIEPREDEHITIDEIKEYLKKYFPKHDIVKWEDLKWLFRELEGWIHEYMDGTKALNRHLKPVEKLKEEYNL